MIHRTFLYPHKTDGNIVAVSPTTTPDEDRPQVVVVCEISCHFRLLFHFALTNQSMTMYELKSSITTVSILSIRLSISVVHMCVFDVIEACVCVCVCVCVVLVAD